jgi:hypothetical protein
MIGELGNLTSHYRHVPCEVEAWTRFNFSFICKARTVSLYSARLGQVAT